MKPKHTPGPWFTVGSDKMIVIRHVAGNTGRDYIAHLEWGGQEAPDRFRANAALIAAAPEMLEQLTRVNAWLLGAPAIDPTDPTEGLNRQSMYERIAEVITKAGGRV